MGGLLVSLEYILIQVDFCLALMLKSVKLVVCSLRLVEIEKLLSYTPNLCAAATIFTDFRMDLFFIHLDGLELIILHLFSIRAASIHRFFFML